MAATEGIRNRHGDQAKAAPAAQRATKSMDEHEPMPSGIAEGIRVLTGSSLRAAGLIVMFVALQILLINMFMKSSSLVWSEFGNVPLEKVLMFWLPIHFQVLFVGFIPPLSIWMLSKEAKWSAPPFMYNAEQRIVLVYHTFPAFTWLLLAALQVYFINEIPEMHAVTGVAMTIPIFGAFIVTAMYSRDRMLSPLGNHVMFLEFWLGTASALYLFISLVSMVFFDNKQMHKIFMTFCILSSTGPGVFRCMRTTRELLMGRLFQVAKYKWYDQALIKGANESEETRLARVKNLQDVESTYFASAFLVTNVGIALVFGAAGMLKEPIIVAGLIAPPAIIAFARICGHRFTPCLDYNFDVFDLPALPEKIEGYHYHIKDPIAREKNQPYMVVLVILAAVGLLCWAVVQELFKH